MNFFKKRNKVYIFPTRMGGYLIGLIFLMFLLSTGYSNNLLLIFTLSLFTLNLMWVMLSHHHLNQLSLEGIKMANGHAGEVVIIKALWARSPKDSLDWKLKLLDSSNVYELNALVNLASQTECSFVTPKRGVYHWEYLKVSNTRPFGLYQTWRYIPIKNTSYSYPHPQSAPLEVTGEDGEGSISAGIKGTEGFVGLSRYEQNESMRISWKHYARTGELLVKEGEELKTPTLDVSLNLPEDANLKEAYLSKIAGQLIECQKQQIPFSLRWSKTHLQAASHPAHLYDCLKVLAQC